MITADTLEYAERVKRTLRESGYGPSAQLIDTLLVEIHDQGVKIAELEAGREEMTDPAVLCIMLTKDRPAMARQAIQCFRNQTYQNRRLLIWDTGDDEDWFEDCESDEVTHIKVGLHKNIPKTIGDTRNQAIEFWTEYPIIVHWDDDDWSHPRRLEDQVEQLTAAPGIDIVGYNQIPFWREATGETWLYTNKNPHYALGTSLCYWRRVWEALPFRSTDIGEDCHFLQGRKAYGCTALFPRTYNTRDDEPMMAARIHAGNTSPAYAPDRMRVAKEWERSPLLDPMMRKAFAE